MENKVNLRFFLNLKVDKNYFHAKKKYQSVIIVYAEIFAIQTLCDELSKHL